MTRPCRRTDTFRWRLAVGAILIGGAYGEWLVIPLVVGSNLTPSIKTTLTAVLGATPLLTKLLAIALLGRPTIDFLKRHSFKLLRKNQAPPINGLMSALPCPISARSGHRACFRAPASSRGESVTWSEGCRP